MFRPILAPIHAGILRALADSDRCKRAVIARTALLARGTVVAVGPRQIRIDGILGQGMTAVTYAATCLASGEPVAYKRARANFDLFTQMFAAEAQASDRLPLTAALTIAPVLARGDTGLLKTRYDGPTLQAALVRGTVTAEQRSALAALLKACRDVLEGFGYQLEPSPKNLCWHGEQRTWVLIDPGQPMVSSDFAQDVLDTCSWHHYTDYYRHKLHSEHSRPSALYGSVMPGRMDAMTAHDRSDAMQEWAFLREWWLWLPCDRPRSVSRFLAHFRSDGVCDEVLYTARAIAGAQAMREAPSGCPAPWSWTEARSRARAEWHHRLPYE